MALLSVWRASANARERIIAPVAAVGQGEIARPSGASAAPKSCRGRRFCHGNRSTLCQ
jgi:hypothetical protein